MELSWQEFVTLLWNYPKSGIYLLIGGVILVKVFLHVKRRIKIKQAIGDERNKRDKNLNLIKESLLASDVSYFSQLSTFHLYNLLIIFSLMFFNNYFIKKYKYQWYRKCAYEM